MFKPKFNYTHKIVNNLVEITSARELILNAYLVPKWEVSLRREALIKATHASTAIEGNPLTLEEVSRLAQGRKVTATRKTKLEVLNYLHVLENIEKYQKDKKITEIHILKLHRDITKGTLDNPEWEGKYREVQVYVGNKITGEIIFTPPSPKEVPILMKEFLAWLNSEKSSKLHPVIMAGISHYEFVRIHPFVDGNGINQWLEYFTEGVRVSILRVKEKVLQLSLERQKQREKGQIALTERQMKIVEFIQRNGQISSGDIRLHPKSRRKLR